MSDDYGYTTGTAGLIFLGGSTSGVLEMPGDKDAFKVYLSGGLEYVFEAHENYVNVAPPLESGDFYLWNSYGTVLESSSYIGSTSPSAVITYKPASSGYYYLQVDGYYSSDTGAYVIRADFLNGHPGDITSPSINYLMPNDEAVQVNIASNISITFDEFVTRGSGNIILRSVNNNEVVEIFNVANSSLVKVLGSKLVINPTAWLDHGVDYKIEIPFGAIIDLAGNSYAGISTYNFRTTDIAPPVLLSIYPSDESKNIKITSDITATFDEAIRFGAGNIVLKTTSGTVIETFNVATSSNLFISGNTLTINPSSDLAYDSSYRITFDSGSIKDSYGNSYSGYSIAGVSYTSYNFSTEINSPPIASSSSALVNEDAVLTSSLPLATDINGHAIVYIQNP